jgi:catechol 2,3-dioxygenase-like lactoylglutathione lyase family enzyme
MQLRELAYFTDDVAQMVTFYRGLLGREPAVESADMAIFMLGDTKLFIHRLMPAAEGDLPPENHTALAVADLDATCAALSARSISVLHAPKAYYWGRSAYFRDPDGHLIELIEESNA